MEDTSYFLISSFAFVSVEIHAIILYAFLLPILSRIYAYKSANPNSILFLFCPTKNSGAVQHSYMATAISGMKFWRKHACGKKLYEKVKASIKFPITIKSLGKKKTTTKQKKNSTERVPPQPVKCSCFWFFSCQWIICLLFSLFSTQQTPHTSRRLLRCPWSYISLAIDIKIFLCFSSWQILGVIAVLTKCKMRSGTSNG